MMMGGYRKLGIITFIISILLIIVIYRINALVLKQLDQTGTLQQPLSVEVPQQVKKEELDPPKMIEGIIIEGQSPSSVITQESPVTSPQSQKNIKAIYEPSSNTPILVQ